MRIARQSHDLRASERFWAGGLGLEVLFRIDESAGGGHALVMVGWPGAAWHLELVHDPDDVTPAAPAGEVGTNSIGDPFGWGSPNGALQVMILEGSVIAASTRC